MSRINADVRVIAEGLRQTEEHAAKLIGGLSPGQTNWRPNDGRSWSIWQCLNHLARMNRVYANSLQGAIAACPARYHTMTKVISPGWFGRWFVHQMGAPPRSKFKAPAKAMPTESGNAQEALKEFIDSHEPVLCCPKSCKQCRFEPAAL